MNIQVEKLLVNFPFLERHQHVLLPETQLTTETETLNYAAELAAVAE